MTKILHFRHHLFQILSIITIGYPFVVYKILAGILVEQIYSSDVLCYVFIAWGVIDLLLNTISLINICRVGSPCVPMCLLSFFLKRHKTYSIWKDAGEALDTMLSFCIVATVVWFGLFPHMTETQVILWNASTVINVLGAGIARLGSTVIDILLMQKKVSND